MMYRQTKFLEILYKIRERISQEVNFDAMNLAKTLAVLYQNNVFTSNEENNTEQKSAADVICEKQS
jgi:hypothetical protein